jgi:hypothetical protein
VRHSCGTFFLLWKRSHSAFPDYSIGLNGGQTNIASKDFGTDSSLFGLAPKRAARILKLCTVSDYLTDNYFVNK